MKLIPFTVAFEGKTQDKDLQTKLMGELPGILAWCVDGCLDWQENGLSEPDQVSAATKAYRSEMDILGDFLLSECDMDNDAELLASQLYGVYVTWCTSNGHRPLSSRRFNTLLRERGFESSRRSHGNYRGHTCWHGIKLEGMEHFE